jgi:flagellar basal body-associated protein FliL
MVKKAKLDLLEEKNAAEEGMGVSPEQGEAPAGARGRFVSGKMFALIACGGVFLSVAVFSIWMYSRAKTVKIAPVALPKQVAVPAAAAVAKEEVAASFPGFVIHLKDGRGNDRTLLCGIALVLNEAPEEAKRIEKRIDLRTVLYATASSKGGELLASRDGMNQLRREINDKMSALLGAGRVKSVYFTEFVIL